MAKYRATVRLSDLEGADRETVRRSLDKRLKRSGFDRFRVVSVEPNNAPLHPLQFPPVRPTGRERFPGERGGLMLVIAVAWAIWFFWYLMS